MMNAMTHLTVTCKPVEVGDGTSSIFTRFEDIVTAEPFHSVSGEVLLIIPCATVDPNHTQAQKYRK
jgi:hypothetical protein